MRHLKVGQAIVLGAGILGVIGTAHGQPGNETIGTASPLSWSAALPNFGSASGAISAYDVDYYAFQVYQGGYVDLGLPGGSSFNLMSPRIDLFDPSGTQIGGVAGRDYLLFLDPGVYYPRISSGSNGIGEYNLTVGGASPYSQGTAQVGAVQAAVPETGTLPLLAVGGAALGGITVARRRRRQG